MAKPQVQFNSGNQTISISCQATIIGAPLDYFSENVSKATPTRRQSCSGCASPLQQACRSHRVLRKLRKALQIVRYRHGSRGLRAGVAAAIEHMGFLANTPFQTVIDAGANKGQFSLAVLCQSPTARVIAFEPLAQPAAKYERLFEHEAGVTLHRLALGASAGQVDMHVSQRDDSSSLLPISGLQTEIFPGSGEVGTESIRVLPMDEMLDVAALPKPVLLKIDVQGYEMELLKGAERSLQSIDDIYCELSFLPMYEGQPLAHDVIEWLQQRGFVMRGVYHIANSAKGLSVQADFHFARQSTVSTS